MNTTEKIVELKNVIAEAAAIIKQLESDPVHGASPFIAGMRSKATALEEHLGAHQVWLEKNPPPAETHAQNSEAGS